jgi:hypothetical protein
MDVEKTIQIILEQQAKMQAEIDAIREPQAKSAREAGAEVAARESARPRPQPRRVLSRQQIGSGPLAPAPMPIAK